MEDAVCSKSLSLSATGEARKMWSLYLGDYSLTEEEYRGRHVYSNMDEFFKNRDIGGIWALFCLESGAWAVSEIVSESYPVMRSTSPAHSPAPCQHWEFRDDSPVLVTSRLQ